METYEPMWTKHRSQCGLSGRYKIPDITLRSVFGWFVIDLSYGRCGGVTWRCW